MTDFVSGKAVCIGTKPKQLLLEKGMSKTLRIMKLTAILLFAAAMHVSAKGIGQDKISLSLKNTPLEKVFGEIEVQTGFVFIYKDETVKDKRISIQVSNVTLSQALDECLKGQALSYQIVGKSVAIKANKKDTDQIGGEPTGTPPFIDVRGRVVNEKGEPLTGVTVLVKGSTKKTMTDSNGEFSLATVEQDAVLVFSHITMETFELKVSGKTELAISLKTKISELSNVSVVLNTGYQQVSKERTVGSFTKVDSALLNRDVSTNLLSRLNGVTNSLLFDTHVGTTQHLQIRGISTIQSGAEPLIVLDNFPYNGNINNINPNDISDVTVLKDAVAASIWGAKAGNGVIIITTKKGKYNQPVSVSLSSNVTVQAKPDLYYFPQMSTSDFIDVEKFLFGKGAYTSNLGNTTTRPIISPVVEILNKQKNGSISQSDADAQIDELRSLDVRNEYDKYVFRKGINQQNFVNVTGGSNNMSYNISGGYDRNLAPYKAPGSYDRYSLSAATTFKPVRMIEIITSVNYTQSEQAMVSFSYPLNPMGGKSQLYPYAKFADADGNHLTIPYKYRLAYIDTVSGGKLLDWHYRPLDELNNQNNNLKTQYLLLNVGARINILPWLNADVKYQYGSQTDNQEALYDINSFFARDLINSYTNLNSTVAATRNPVPVGGILDKSNTSIINKNFRAQLNFSQTWNNIHELNGMIAGEVGEVRNQNFSDRIYGFDKNKLSYSNQVDYNTYYPSFLTGSTSQIPGNLGYGNTTTRNASFLANGSYRFNKRYSVYASARKDGSNFFGVQANNRWKPLWSVGAGWDVMKEPFYNVKFLSTLRLRASYGYTGNTNNAIPAVTIITYGANNPITGTPTASLTFAENPNLRWEEVGILNLGFDFGMFDNRISGTAEWFEKKSSDVIAKFEIDPTLGINSNLTTLNAANLNTKGIDIQLNTQNIVSKFSWNTTLNFSYAKTIVTNYFQNPIKGIPTISDINPAKGNIAWGIYAYQWGGLDPLTGDPQGYYTKDVSKNYTNIINDSFQNHKLMGSSIPLYFGNMLNTFSYKNFTLSANIIYKFAYYFRKPTISYTNLFNSWIGNDDYARRWQTPGDEEFTTVPSMIYPGNSNRDLFYANSEVNVEKGDHIRLNDIRLSYNFQNRNLPSWVPIKNCQLFAYANNLNVIIWKASKTNLNPDYASSIIPPQKSIALGLSIKF